MFWKKKLEVDQEVRYSCVGVNHGVEVEINGENLDELKEELFQKFKQLDKIYTRIEIDTMSEKLGYDVWNSFGWMPWVRKGQAVPKKVTQIFIKYRFEGIKTGLVEGDTAERINVILIRNQLYKRTEIEYQSMKIGISLWERCDWKQFAETEIVLTDLNVRIVHHKLGA